ncbi:MAG: hypothetical protein V1755_06505 [Chloroflexota bacterium]
MNRTRQAALNVDRFTALPDGAFFELYGWSPVYGYMLHNRFQKVDAEHVRTCGDGRVWPFAHTEGSGASVVLVPEGDSSIRPFDARANNQFVEVER